MRIGTKYTKKDLEGKVEFGNKLTFHEGTQKNSFVCPVCKEEYTGQKYAHLDQVLEEIENGKEIFAQCEKCSEDNKKPYIFQIIEDRKKAYRKPVSFAANVYSIPVQDSSGMPFANIVREYKKDALFPATVTTITNLSVGGLQIKTSSTRHIINYLKDKNIMVDFHLDNKPKSHIQAECKVCYVNKHKDHYTIGMEFKNNPSKQMIGFYFF